MKLATYNSVTRRKLIRVLMDFGSEYYLVTNGSDPAYEDRARDQLKDASKEVLLNVLRVKLFEAYDMARTEQIVDVLVHYANCLGRHGIETPWSHELPTRTGIKLISEEVRKYFSWERLPYCFGL